MKIKDIALSAAYVGQMVVKAICVGAQEIWSAVKYIVFADPVVAQICATNFGDGSGLTEEDAAKVTSIGTIFRGNTEITSFDEFEYFTRVAKLEASAFEGCSQLESIKLPQSVIELGHYAFKNCSKLKEIYVRQVEKITGSTFEGALDGANLIFDNLYHVGFAGLRRTGAVYMEFNHPVEFGGEACAENTRLIIVKIGNNVAVIPKFGGSTSLVDIDITDNRTIIGISDHAFSNVPLDNISDVRLPNLQVSSRTVEIFSTSNIYSMSDMGRINGEILQAITVCPNLGYVAIPYGVTKQSYNWNRCNALRTMVVNPIVPPTSVSRAAPDNVSHIYVPDESVQSYKDAALWINFSSKIFPMSNYVTYEDVTSQLVSDVVYATPTEAYAKFDNTQIAEAGAKSLICDVTDYGFLRISGTGGTTSRLYCFLDDNDEVVTTSEESLIASPLYIIIPKIATKMVVNLLSSSSAMKVEIGKHVEQ